MNATRLKEILDRVRQQPDLAPRKDGTTFCNIALDRILGLYGAARMTAPKNVPLMANDMVDFMRNNPQLWVPVNGDVACARASQGVLVVAAQQADGHGHVAAVYPAPMEYSGSWNKEVPMLNNIGKKNAVMRASMCFHAEPEYFSVRISGAA
jgi:hypothetical protein